MCFVDEDDGISKNTRRRKEAQGRAQGILKGSRGTIIFDNPLIYIHMYM